MTTERIDAYGGIVTTIAAAPDLKTAPIAAAELGISTQKFNKLRRGLAICGVIVTGTEKNKYPAIVYSADDVARIGEEAAR